MSSPPHFSPAAEPAMIAEQRLFLRRKVTLPLPIELLPGKEVWLDDVGEGGLSVSGSSRLALGTTTFFVFPFPDANTVIEAAGVVAWCDTSGRAGVRFTRIKPDSTAALKRWLKNDPSALSAIRARGESNLLEGPAQVPRPRDHVESLKADLAGEELGSEEVLDLIVERMIRLTRATGAAIAWRDGGDVICRASRGNAPAAGVKLNVDASLTGQCYRTGNIVALADSENDARVSAELCRQLDFRSLLIVPISWREEAIGIVEVFSPIPSNFDGGDVLLLGSIAELIAEIYGRNQALAELETDFKSIPSNFQNEISEGEAQNLTGLGSPTEAVSRTKAKAHDPSQSFSRNATTPTNKIISLGAPDETLLPAAGADSHQEADSALFAEGLAAEGVATPPKKRSTPIFIAVLLALFGLGVGDYLDWHLPWRGTGVQKADVPATAKALPVAAPGQPKIPEQSVTVTPAEAIQPVESASAMSLPRTGKPAAQSESLNPNFDKHETTQTQAFDQAPAAPALVGGAPISQFNSIYPVLTGNPDHSSRISILTSAPTQITPGKLIRRVNPVFPQFARTAGIGGKLVLSATISKDGYLKNVKLLSGNEALAIAAFRALREWRYTPYLRNGQPIEAQTQIVIDFNH